MINLAIAGVTGRMGRAIVRELASSETMRIRTALTHSKSRSLAKDVGLLSGGAALNVLASCEADDTPFEVMVDFSHPAAISEHLSLCLQRNAGIVIGLTGLAERQQQEIAQAARTIPVLLAPNTSVGVHLCAALVATASGVLGGDMDIEIVEAHHKHKVDAPSGTALLLGESAANALNRDLKQDGVFSRVGQIGERQQGTIGFSTVRGGDIAGEHTVMFIGESERVEITHKATDRKIFARGAVRAASWLARQDRGLYGMKDVLGLNRSAE